jgi:hypothetical protein
VGSKARQAGGLCRDGGDPVDFNISVKAQVGKGDFLFQALSTNDSNSNL